MDGPGPSIDVIGNSGPANKYPDKLGDSESGSPQPSLAVASGPSKHRVTHSSQTDTTRVEPYPVRPASEGCGETLFSTTGKTSSQTVWALRPQQSINTPAIFSGKQNMNSNKKFAGQLGLNKI